MRPPTAPTTRVTRGSPGNRRVSAAVPSERPTPCSPNSTWPANAARGTQSLPRGPVVRSTTSSQHPHRLLRRRHRSRAEDEDRAAEPPMRSCRHGPPFGVGAAGASAGSVNAGGARGAFRACHASATSRGERTTRTVPRSRRHRARMSHRRHGSRWIVTRGPRWTPAVTRVAARRGSAHALPWLRHALHPHHAPPRSRLRGTRVSLLAGDRPGPRRLRRVPARSKARPASTASTSRTLATRPHR
jgi:hypothetical protein